MADLYVDTVKRVIAGELTPPHDLRIPVDVQSSRWRAAVVREAARRGMELTRTTSVPESCIAEGRWWPGGIAPLSWSMIGRRRLDNVQSCVDAVLRDGVDGDLVETGVWRGGASILMRAVLEARGDPSKHVVLCDSFQGLPNPDPSAPLDDTVVTDIDWLAVDEKTVRSNFERFGLLDDRVEFVAGWFKDTLPSMRDRSWSVLRLDGDLYSSTMTSLDNLYDGLQPGGWIIIDDYNDPYLAACKEAVTDFRDKRGIREPILEVDWTGVCWQKSG